MRKIMIALAAALATTACGDSSDSSSNTAASAPGGADDTAMAATDVPDACTFFAKAELETAVGTELRNGEPQSVADPSESSCRFRKQLGSRATKTFADPALPPSVGFESMTISTSPADAGAVAEIRQLDPGAFEDVQGLGDDAYYLGPALLNVRVGGRGFSIRVDPEATSPADQGKVREVMLALARTGASRL